MPEKQPKQIAHYVNKGQLIQAVYKDDRLKLYVNGSRLTAFDTDTASARTLTPTFTEFDTIDGVLIIEMPLFRLFFWYEKLQISNLYLTG